MGTDIMCCAERRTAGGWESCGDEFQNHNDDFYCGQERNYELYAILAAVQRMTNDGFDPIVPPRGFPEDSPSAAEVGAGHNATWLTLRELLDFPWHEKFRVYRGYVDETQFRCFRDRGRPESFAGGDADVVSNDEMDRLIRDGADAAGKQTLIEFGVSYAEFAGPFLTETLPRLQQLGGPDDVRLVMSFDS
jgi:hypothetical protein